MIDERVVGRSLIRTYRECALATLAQNFKRSMQLEKFLLTLAWDKLNTGNFGEVDEAWRIFHGVMMLCKAVRLKFENKIQVRIF